MFYLRDDGNDLNLFDEFNNVVSSAAGAFMKADITEDENEYVVNIDVPGVLKKDINLSFDNKKLNVSVNQTNDSETDKKNYIRRERYRASYKRTFFLSEGDSQNVKASLNDGVLTVVVAKKKVEETKNVISID